jgi:hypothetical protein
MRHPQPKTILYIPHLDNLYCLDSSAVTAPDLPMRYTNVIDGPISIGELHRHMDHINFQTLHEMVQNGAMEGVNLDFSPMPTFCKACIQGKAHRKAFPSY